MLQTRCCAVNAAALALLLLLAPHASAEYIYSFFAADGTMPMQFSSNVLVTSPNVEAAPPLNLTFTATPTNWASFAGPTPFQLPFWPLDNVGGPSAIAFAQNFFALNYATGPHLSVAFLDGSPASSIGDYAINGKSWSGVDPTNPAAGLVLYDEVIISNSDPVSTPEPSSLTLLATGLAVGVIIGMVSFARRRTCRFRRF